MNRVRCRSASYWKLALKKVIAKLCGGWPGLGDQVDVATRWWRSDEQPANLEDRTRGFNEDN